MERLDLNYRPETPSHSGWQHLAQACPFSERLAAPALYATPNCTLYSVKCAAKSSVEGSGLLLEDDTGKIPQHHFDPASLIDSTPGPIHVPQPDARTLDGCRELSKFSVKPATDKGPGILIQMDSQYADMDRSKRSTCFETLVSR
jgi:hypothetical protein